MDNPHDYLITSPSRPRRPTDPDCSTSWVMLNQGGFVKLGNERILLKLESRISCELSVPQELKARCNPFQCKSDKGTLFLTNKRIVYLPTKPTQEPKFESFSAPILKFQDSSTSSSMWWGWVWKSDCIPVSGGNIPPDLPRIEVKFTFSDGGMMEFNEAYIRLRERLFQYQEMRREMGPGADVPDEPLPAYEGPGTNPPESTTTLTVPRANRSDSSSSRRAPNEPPPGYDEAQAQQISMRLEDHIRGEADRGATDE
ncbi:WW-domain-binding protein [Metarhizium rileyi]|uniref:WW-domain-binding protein n=1 Tax=Metarhizium rileyi (strain RCEF 4871) TaxID=1649241 RepID=A0A167KHE4_METRR|nr:WW-domain-binding protein [Metarhizium rileyi RCEF 4871]